MMRRSDNCKLNVLLFILGLMVGGTVSFFLAGMLQTRRIDRYEQIVVKLRKQNKILADALPKDNRKTSLALTAVYVAVKQFPKDRWFAKNVSGTVCKKLPVIKSAFTSFFAGLTLERKSDPLFIVLEEKSSKLEYKKRHSHFNNQTGMSFFFICKSVHC